MAFNGHLDEYSRYFTSMYHLLTIFTLEKGILGYGQRPVLIFVE